MKKKVSLLICFTLFFFFPIIINAKTITGTVNATGGVMVRKKAGTTSSSIGKVTYEQNVTIDLDQSKKTEDSSTKCPSGGWYYITEPYKGYICSSYISIPKITPTITKEEMKNLTDEQFIEYLKTEGFPESYHNPLLEIHKNHPTWIFKGINTYRDWDDIMDSESVLGTSLIQVTKTRKALGYEGYLDTSSGAYSWEEDKFVAMDGSTWFSAQYKTIEYYLDPRNALTESSLFMFEDLSYDSTQTKEMIEKILVSDYTDLILQAGKEANISAMFLATRIRQEGVLTTNATKGGKFTCDGETYEGYYNFFNIGATSGSDPVTNGLCYAVSKGWNTKEKAMIDGAKIIAKNYINQGQYSIYFQKWNTSPSTENSITHQYMTNIEAPKSESAIAYESYKKLNMINNEDSFIFYIPYYYDMPEQTTLPALGNPNNYLKSLKIDNTEIENFKGSTTVYQLTVSNDKENISFACEAVNSKATIKGCGTVTLQEGNNEVEIVVTAENGSIKTYKITITKEKKDETNNENTEIEVPEDEKNEETEEPKEEIILPTVTEIIKQMDVKTESTYISGLTQGMKANKLKSSILSVSDTATVAITDSKNQNKTTAKLATGDKVTITSGKDQKTYTVVIYGDTNGDGEITAIDLLRVQKHILNYSKLTGVYKEAADTNKDGNISAIDLLQVQKDILGYSNIKQL